METVYVEEMMEVALSAQTQVKILTLLAHVNLILHILTQDHSSATVLVDSLWTQTAYATTALKSTKTVESVILLQESTPV